jgi:hypothetical protein
MNRARIIWVMSGGLLLVVGALLLALTPNARAAAGERLPRLPSLVNSSAGLASTAGVACTLSTTTTNIYPFNQDFDSAVQISAASSLALVPTTYVVPGSTVSVQTIDNFFWLDVSNNNSVNLHAIPANSAGNYFLGIEVYDFNRNLIVRDNDTATPRADISLTVNPTYGGRLYFRIYQLAVAQVCTGGYYSLEFSNATPTPTPSLTPTQTPTSTPTKTITPTPGAFACTIGSDKFEPNNDYDTATTLGLGVKYTGLNFVECVQSDDSWDVDYFKVRVKPGMLVTCRTLDLTSGTDTNLILYDVSKNGINGSDDVNRADGNLSSSVTYYVTYEGWLYGLVGESFHRPQSEQAAAAYSYECFIGAQSTPTEAPTPTEVPGQPTRTPVPTIPPTPTITLTPTPTLSPTPPFIRIVPLPSVTPAGLPAQSIPVSLQVYYDIDSNNKPDPGEGVVGVSARVFDLTNGNLLDQKLTDQAGRASFTVSAIGAVQLVVPYFNFSSIILPSTGGSAVIRISPHELPSSIP